MTFNDLNLIITVLLNLKYNIPMFIYIILIFKFYFYQYFFIFRLNYFLEVLKNYTKLLVLLVNSCLGCHLMEYFQLIVYLIVMVFMVQFQDQDLLNKWYSGNGEMIDLCGILIHL